jgi:uncharacterized damage-inducible protein DinB
MLTDLLAYQSWADSQIVAAVKAHPPAATDPEVLKTLHHIAGVQRFFLSQIENRGFDVQREMQVPSTIDALDQLFTESQADLARFAATLSTLDLATVLERPPLDKMRPTIGTALLQMILHSQHHRGQLAMRLRALGATPPTVDYILWAKSR